MAKEGRPPKFTDVKKLQEDIDAFFLECDTKEDPYTITGLALKLDTTRSTLLDYENREDEFSDTIKAAKLRVENYAEKLLLSGKGSPVGSIFALKNFGWADKVVQEHTGDAFSGIFDAISGKTEGLPE